MQFKQWNRIRDWALLIGLLSISSIVMFAQNISMVRALRAASLETTGHLENSLSWVGRYFRALDENDLLREENIRLSSELAKSREANIENERLSWLSGFVDTVAYDVLSARIIEKEITRQKNYITLNVGKKHGVLEGMGVIDERGIIGKVVQVTPNYSQVMSYLNMDFRLPAKIQPSQAQGIISWEGVHRDRLLLEHVIRTERVSIGQIVVTSGYSSIFPSGYPVGLVLSVEPQTGKNQLLIEVVPASKIDDAEHAFVVLKEPEPEKELLVPPE